MKKTIALMVCALIAMTCFCRAALAAGMTKEEKRLEIAWQLMNLADFAATGVIIDQGGHELNPVIGDRPSNLELAGWCAAGAGLHYWVTRNIPEKYRKAWQYGTLVIKGGVVGWNLTIIEF